MSVTATYGAKQRSKRAWGAAIIAAAVLTVMLLAQLFEYEDFIIILGSLLPFNDIVMTKIVAACLVLVELLAIPYLLGMYMSALMRFVSACFAGLVAVFWLFTSFTNAHAVNSGLFSTTLEIPGGILATAWSLLLFCVTVILLYEESRSGIPLEKKAKLR